MCLISQLREPQDVMSADDPSVATAAAEPGSELSSPLPAKNVSLTTSTPHNTKNESSKINVSASNLSLPVSESAESELNLKAKAEDTVSLESEGGELKKENAQSAFAITSVIQGDLDNDDLENNLNPRQPVSLDDSQMKLTESEEDSVSLSEDQRMTASSTEQSGSTAPVVEVAIVTTDGLSSSVTQTQPVNSNSPLSSTSLTDTVKISPTQQQQGGQLPIGAATSNGPSVPPGPSRFRRVNQYNRGRWKVRDTESTEERADSDPLKGLPSNSSAYSSPSTKRRSEDGLHSRSASELGQLSDTVSDKDSTAVPFDHSSIAAEGTLSRNTSASSLLPDKSIDGDEQPPDLTDESTATSLAGSSVALPLKDTETLEIVPSTISSQQTPPILEVGPSNATQEQQSTVPPSSSEHQVYPPNGPIEIPSE